MTDIGPEEPDRRSGQPPGPDETSPQTEPPTTPPSPWSRWDEPAGPAPLPPPPPPVPHDAGPGGPPPRRRRGRIVAAVVAALVLLGGGAGIGLGVSGVLSHHPSTLAQADRTLNVQAIANRVSPAVVDISTYTSQYVNSGATVPLGAGTGMVLTSSGEVLTNNHVVQGATVIRVSIQGRSGTYTARVLGVSPSADVALIQVEGVSNLKTVSLGNSSGVTLGQEVVALGNALGQGGSPTVTSGHISALDRNITVANDSGGVEHLVGMMQSDASISPGDSGGPLVDNTGKVVGMITAAATNGPQQTASTVGYAIPIDKAVGIVNQIRSGHETSGVIIGPTGFLGVQVRNLTPQIAAQLGLSRTSGALVVGVIPGTPAAQAGIPRYAIITAVDGRKVASADALGPHIYTHAPGDTIRVTWVDQSGTHTATVRLIAGPAA